MEDLGIGFRGPRSDVHAWETNGPAQGALPLAWRWYEQFDIMRRLCYYDMQYLGSEVSGYRSPSADTRSTLWQAQVLIHSRR